MSIAVIGPGAIGGTVAAWLAHTGQDVVVCARTGFTDLLVQTPDGPISVTPTVLTSPEMAAPVDWVMIATKAYDVVSVEPWLARLVGPHTRVAVLQNGVEHIERFAAMVVADRIVPAVVDIPSVRTAPGRITQHRYGSITVADSGNGRAFVALFAQTPIAVSTTDDFVTRMWLKLCRNCVGAVSALTLRSTGPSWNDDVEEIVRGLVTECVLVARAQGAVLGRETVDAVLDDARLSPADAINSMHADRLAGRPMEYDARNGVIVRTGLLHGIATPFNAMVVALLSAC